MFLFCIQWGEQQKRAAPEKTMKEARNRRCDSATKTMEQKNNTVRNIIIGVAAVVAAVIIALLCFRSCSKEPVAAVDQPAETAAAAGGLEMDANAEEGGLVYRSKEEIQEELNRKVEEGMINISMNTAPVFENGTSEGNLLIVNNERNNYPQIVYIVRKDTGDEIYRSKGIPVGSKIENAKLDVALPAGTYECVAYFNNADPNTGAILGTAGAEIVITVLH